ncbi:MAG TPA: AbrB/MazE/SpoVT family DNA-binding domain-containing protein [Chloroflexota bacterium]|nr:AbrB/MazE/SpoVT family DNA-binding domain-containing protein [Chloroflexota bacterium]
MGKPFYLNVQRRGVIALPPELRRRHHMDEPGAQVLVTEREDGVIELRPHVAVPADQAWFWTPEWQAGEREADEQIARGEIETFDNVDDFLAALEADWKEAHADE